MANAADADDESTADIVEPDLKCTGASDSTVVACAQFYHASQDGDRISACDPNVCNCENGTPVRAHNRCIPVSNPAPQSHTGAGWLRAQRCR